MIPSLAEAPIADVAADLGRGAEGSSRAEPRSLRSGRRSRPLTGLSTAIQLPRRRWARPNHVRDAPPTSLDTTFDRGRSAEDRAARSLETGLDDPTADGFLSHLPVDERAVRKKLQLPPVAPARVSASEPVRVIVALVPVPV